MTKERKGAVAWLIGALLMVLCVVPSTVSIASGGDGAVCITDSGCPLSTINPCVHKPSFALMGRCAIPIK